MERGKVSRLREPAYCPRVRTFEEAAKERVEDLLRLPAVGSFAFPSFVYHRIAFFGSQFIALSFVP